MFSDGDPAQYVAWYASAARPVAFDPAHGYGADETRLALRGTYELPTSEGPAPDEVVRPGDSSRPRRRRGSRFAVPASAGSRA